MKKILVVMISLLVMALWTFATEDIFFFIYNSLGSPEAPRYLLLNLLVGLVFLFSFIPSLITSLSLRNEVPKFDFFYLVPLILCLLIFPIINRDISDYAFLFSAYATWSFLIGAFLGVFLGACKKSCEDKTYGPCK